MRCLLWSFVQFRFIILYIKNTLHGYAQKETSKVPIFEYVCDKCGKFENLQMPSEQDLTKCPTCGSDVKKLMSTRMGIVFKGSGFYCTDNRPANYGGDSSND